MTQRFVSLWFRHLRTDWFTLRRPALGRIPFVLTTPEHGRIVITAANALAKARGITIGMPAADARAVLPGLEVLDDIPDLPARLLTAIAGWSIRFTPLAAIDQPDGLMLDVSGCTHLWGGDYDYLKDIVTRLKAKGYDVRAAMAGTIGTAWAVARYGKTVPIIGNGEEAAALSSLPPAALRLDRPTLDRLQKLGLYQAGQFLHMPRASLRRRFSPDLLVRIDQALGRMEEPMTAVYPPEAFLERLPCLEPILTLTGIQIGLQRLLDMLCHHLQQEGKGLRTAIFKGYRVDGKIEQVDIGTNRPTHNTTHLFRLFEEKLGSIEPDLGIELFTLEAPKVEGLSPLQESLWENTSALENPTVSELLDRLTGKLGAGTIHRYLPDEHHWPERSIRHATEITEMPATSWPTNRPRPAQLLSRPEPIEVAAPIPDYPPLHFRYKGLLHKIAKADGPERIEREWWLDQGPHRDYYCVEDDEGQRYWLFRSGHYTAEKPPQWYIHGFFA
ncbi:MAG TPA: DNA polymerase Y family protein [Puia sp.]|jgi:protein ImuB